MRFRIIEERHYNEFNELIETKFKVKEQTSFLGFSYWMFLQKSNSSYQGTYYTKLEESTIGDIEKMLDKYIEEQLDIIKTTSVKIERLVVKEITKE